LQGGREEREGAGDGDDEDGGAVAHAARRERQVGLVDPVDLDVGDLVEADDVEVDGEAREERGGEERPALPSCAVGREEIQDAYGERGADDGVGTGELPEHPQGGGRRVACGSRGT